MHTIKRITILLTIITFSFTQLQGCTTTSKNDASKYPNQSHSSNNKNQVDDSHNPPISPQAILIGTGVVVAIALLAGVIINGMCKGMGQSMAGNIA